MRLSLSEVIFRVTVTPSRTPARRLFGQMCFTSVFPSIGSLKTIHYVV